jgi:hypothetical protein
MEIDEKILEGLRTKWIDIGMQTGDCDLEAAIPIINKIYENGGIAPPEFFFAVTSPIEAMQYSAALSELGYDKIKKSKTPYALVEKTSKKINKKDLDRSQLCFGNHEAASLSFYDYFVNNTDVKDIEPAIPFMELAKVCGWWIPLRKAAILVNFPSIVKLDDRGLGHCADGPAIAYNDSDFAIYIWHGVRIPAEWIRDKSLTPEIALMHPQVEQCRAACEILGWEKVLESLHTNVIDTDDNPEYGQLLEVDLPEIGTERFLKVQCGTGRTFVLPVPPDMTTAREANAWTYGVAANEYTPEVRT